MKTSSWPFNYPNSDDWPPRRRWPVVNSYAEYPGMEIINNALKYNEVDMIPGYLVLDSRYANVLNGPSLLQAIETEFKQNLEPELRKLWKPILDDFEADEDSVSKLIDFSIRHLKMTLESALFGGTTFRDQGKRALGKQLAKARLLADDDSLMLVDGKIVTISGSGTVEYEKLINQQYPNAPFRNVWDEPAPFSRYVLGKYPETLFDICGIRDFDLEARELQVFTYAQAVELAKQFIEPMIGEFSANWLSTQTGLPEAIFTGLLIIEAEERESAVMALINATCGMDELVDSALDDYGFNSYLGWEYSNDGDPYKIFTQDYLVGVVE